MAKIHKLTQGGQTIYPATTTDAVVHPTTRKNLTEELSNLESKTESLSKITGVSSAVIKFSKQYELKELPFTIFRGSVINLLGDVSTITCRTNKEDSDYQTVMNGTIADRDIRFVKNNNVISDMVIFTSEDGGIYNNLKKLIADVSGFIALDAVIDNFFDIVPQLISSQTLETGRVNYTDGSTTSGGFHYKISFNKGEYKKIKVRIYSPYIGGETNIGYAFKSSEGTYISGGTAKFLEGNAMYSMEIIDVPDNAEMFVNTAPSDKNIPEGIVFIKSGLIESVLSEIDAIKKDVAINLKSAENLTMGLFATQKIVGLKKAVELSFDTAYQMVELPFLINSGEKICLYGDVSTITCRTNKEDSDYQTVMNGTIADRDIKFIKNDSSKGNLIIYVKTESLLSKLPVHKIIDTAFIEIGGFLTIKETSRKVALFDIKNKFNVKIHIPKDGNKYSLTYAYSETDSLKNGSKLILPDESIIGESIERTLIVKNTNNYHYAIITFDESKTPTAHLEDLNSQIQYINKNTEKILAIEKSLANNKRADIVYKVRPAKILWIGNSFSDLSTNLLGRLFKKIGFDIVIGLSYQGGATLEFYDKAKESNTSKSLYLKYKDGEWLNTMQNAPSNTLIDKLNDENWDIIFFQQGSASSGLYSTYIPYFQSLQEWLPKRIQSLGYKVGWLMPWAWSDKRISEVGGNLDGGLNNEEMYANIASATNQLIDNFGDYINIFCPCGTAVQNQFNYYSQDDLYGSSGDGQHPLDKGYYASTCTLFHKIAEYLYNKNLNDIVWSEELGVDKDLFDKAKESAINAINNPFNKTDL